MDNCECYSDEGGKYPFFPALCRIVLVDLDLDKSEAIEIVAFVENMKRDKEEKFANEAEAY